MKINVNNLFDANQIKIDDNVSNIDSVLEYEQILLCISKAIVKYRNENKLTQSELAKKLNVNQVMISKLERGTYNPTIKLLYNISRKLTNSSNLFISLLKDMITDLYKSKNVQYTIQFKKYETYKYKTNDNITYLVNEYNNKNNYGGMIYGEISSASAISVNG